VPLTIAAILLAGLDSYTFVARSGRDQGTPASQFEQPAEGGQRRSGDDVSAESHPSPRTISRRPGMKGDTAFFITSTSCS
jgi:hypothetical protein